MKTNLTVKTLVRDSALLLLLFFIVSASGQSASLSLAKEVAVNHYYKYNNVNELSYKDINISEYFVYTEYDDTLIYVFNINENNGFVIVSADKRLYPIIGYSFEAYYNNEEKSPGFNHWLERRKKEISYIIENDLPACEKAVDKWNYLAKKPSLHKGGEVQPLISTKWNQNCYYNYYCPEDSEVHQSYCGKVPVGCVAVAQGQIMKYWSYPNTGTGSNSYNHPNYGTLSANFGSAQYNYSNMPNTLNSHNSDLATLLYHCGVSVQMNYGPTGSGATSVNMGNAMINYFSYSTDAQLIYDQSYSSVAWNNIIKQQLDLGQPVYYAGYGNYAHAFVCDGYQNNNYFHFNWGWGGWHDGYFYLNDLSPGQYEFNDFSEAIINLYPDEDVPQPTDCEFGDFEFNIGSGAGYTLYSFSNAWGFWTGHNEYGWNQFAEKFSYTNNMVLNGFTFAPFYVHGNNFVTFKVWDSNNGTPGNILKSVNINYNEMTGVQGGQMTANCHEFAEPVVVGSEFFVGYKINYGASIDTFALVQTQINENVTYNSFYFHSGSEWTNMPQATENPNNKSNLVIGVNTDLHTIVNKEPNTDLLQIYPNPTTGVINIISKHLSGNSIIQILDSKGSLVKTNTSLLTGMNNINISDLPSGIYLIRVINDDFSQSKRILLHSD